MQCSLQIGIVSKVNNFPGKQELKIMIGLEEAKAINYPELTGLCQAGDEVVLNTTAMDLTLGTGGWHYVLAIWGQERSVSHAGHIMKLRYTPLQGAVLSVEEQASPHHEIMKNAENLSGMVTAVGSLHSMLSPLVWLIKESIPQARIAYLMSDGAALPLAFSNAVFELKKQSLITKTITFGHAFGGDFEAVNIYSALLAAKHVVQADFAIVLMGPGVVGTNTKWGTTAVEQGVFLNAVRHLGGTPVAIPRLSSGEQRARHLGFSHHLVTVLQSVVDESVLVALPLLLKTTLEKLPAGIESKHEVNWFDTDAAFARLLQSGLHLSTMGRGATEDPLFFHGVTAAALQMISLFERKSLA